MLIIKIKNDLQTPEVISGPVWWWHRCEPTVNACMARWPVLWRMCPVYFHCRLSRTGLRQLREVRKWKCKWGKIILAPSSLEAILPASGSGAHHRSRWRMKFRLSYKNPLLPPQRTALHHLQLQRRLLTSFFAKKVHQAAQARSSFNGGPSGDSKGSSLPQMALQLPPVVFV